MLIKQFALIIISLLLLVSFHAGAESETFNRYTEELTQSLETDALSALTSGYTYEVEARLCQRLKGSEGQAFQIEYEAWQVRNDDYIKGAAKALNDIGSRYIPRGGEAAKQGYFQSALRASVAESMKRVANEMDGSNLNNAVPPKVATCLNYAKAFHQGKADFKNIPEESTALLEYMKRTTAPALHR